ncbi:autotransporter assembly complex protein TamA [Balneatrix alpica]|uniref:Translocation and assembly module subunit TamA n=1 Tax=Balneatrix alpica TaxID=75684 RepID=A0ABV5ZA30_9GAMM|nr:autotransporter assembly complex family protein [Balneatrix alpica]
MKRHRLTGWILSAGLAWLLPGLALAESHDGGVAAAAEQPSLPVRVSIQGVKGEQLDNVRQFLSLARLPKETAPTASRLGFLHRQASKEIAAALAPYGYYQVQVDAILELEGDHWLARYRIDPGPRITLAEVDIRVIGEAAEDVNFRKVLAEHPLQPGQPLLHADYDQLKATLTSLAAERGYYDARFVEQRLEVDLLQYRASVQLVLDTGARYRIGEVRFSETPIRQELLHRYVQFPQQAPVSTKRLLELQTALVDTDYFSRVEVQPLWAEANQQQVPVQVVLEPNKRTSYRFGVGYGTDTGARLRFDQKRRWLNSYGHTLDIQARLSQVKNDVAISYGIPGSNPVQDQFQIKAAINTENSLTTDSQAYVLGAGWQRQSGAWQRKYGIDWQRESYRLDEQSLDTQLLLPYASFSTLETDDRLNPREGYRFSLEARAAAEGLLSDTHFVQIKASGKHVLSLGERWRLLSRAELGGSWAGDFDKIPSSLRFFAGGDNSVRGYGYKSLGPTSASGKVIGGKYKAVLSAEVDYRFNDSWSLASFIDAGNAFNQPTEAISTGVGLGLRWQSPVGPVRIDLAKPLNDDKAFRIHFSLGPDL